MKVIVGLVLALPVAAQMSAEDRAQWFVKSTFGVRSLAVGGPFSAGIRTLRNRPVEWGRTPEGFAKRYGYRLVNNSVTNGVEAIAGAAWGEDPRYERLGSGGGGARLGNALKRTFVANYDDGATRFAFARAAGIVSGAFAQNAWMPDSVTSNRDAMWRIGGGYMGRLVGNVFREFGPDMKKVFRRK